jgi:hypothetical protein
MAELKARKGEPMASTAIKEEPLAIKQEPGYVFLGT